MVYPHEHVLLRFNGHFGTGTSTIVDRWSAGIRIGHPTQSPAYDVAKLQTLVNAAQTAANTFHASAGAAVGTNCWLDYVSGAQIGVSGKYTPSTQLTVVSPTTPTAGSGTPALPWNTANVISLRTNQPRGRASNGRVYWPCLALPVVPTTGRVASAARVTAAKTFMDALNAAANVYSAGERIVVASNVGGGLIATVTAIRSDDRLDSVERRENDQPSTWQTATLAP
jgi:hypothetical protein